MTPICSRLTSAAGPSLRAGRRTLLAVAFAIVGPALGAAAQSPKPALSDFEWRARLTAEQYAVLRTSATEAAFSSPLDEERRSGRYDFAGCGAALFRSTDKFDSGTGGPSFIRDLPQAVVETKTAASDRRARRCPVEAATGTSAPCSGTDLPPRDCATA